MSGAEAGFVIGLIGSLISIVDVTKKIHDAAGDAKGQPEAFRQVAARLPLVIEILRSAQAAAPELDKTKWEAIEPILKSCKAKAENLQEIFQKVVRKDDDQWFDRYKKALRTLGKGDKVECLMEGIQKDTQLLVCEKLMGIATEEQVKGLEEGIKEMKEMSASVQEDTWSVTQMHSGTGDNIGHSGSGNNYGGNSHHNQNSGDVIYGNNDPKACLKDLRTTDPRDDKRRIEETKGGLLRNSYRWILDNSKFRRWHDDKHSQLLWIRGDPGKGKTMLLCGIIDKLEETASAASASGSSCLLSYFFCQATDDRINSATAVLRGLIYLLADQEPALLQHVRKKYDNTGKALFVDTNSWFALSEIFINILQDPGLGSTYVIIDALDECKIGLQQLLQFIEKTSPAYPRVKWIISSRNWPSIEEQLRISDKKFQLRLELNQDSISAAVSTYIEHKVSELAKRKKYNAKLEYAVQEYLSSNADATFLWVALVLQGLETIDRRNALMRVRTFPPGLSPLYEQMMVQVSESDNADLCKRILSIVAVVQRPITLEELVSLDDTLHELDCPEDLSDDIEDLEQTVGQCGSFLTIRDSTVYFVHQSAKDFFLQETTSQELFRSGISEVNHAIFSRSLQVMSIALRRDVYDLRAPGIMIDQVNQPDPDPLAAVRYSCLYWVDHLLECHSTKDIMKDDMDSSLVYNFLRQYFLCWLEALSLLKSVSEGIIMIRKLENLQFNKSPDFPAFIHDGRRFAVSTRSIIEQAPLQVYYSALMFAPENSIIRETFEGIIPSWIQIKSKVETSWNATLQVLEGHIGFVNSVAFSPDGKKIVSGSYDRTVRRWDTATGQQLLPALEGHTHGVTSVAFSPGGKQIVSGSYDKTVRRWDAATGQQLLPVLKGHTGSITLVAFSPDGKQIVSGSRDTTIRRWDAATGEQLLPVFKSHTDYVSSVAFSPDSKQIVSGSTDKIVRRWDAATGQQLLPTLEGHTNIVTSVAFSPDGKQIVSGSWDMTIRRWDAATGQQLLPALEGHTNTVTSVAFSPDGKQIVSGSWDTTIRRWDATTSQQLLPVFKSHTNYVSSVAFSPDSKQIVSGSRDETVRHWDAAISQQLLLPALEGHTDTVTSVSFSTNGKQIVSGSYDKTVRRWDAATGQQLLPVLKGHTGNITSVAFSSDGKQIVSVSTVDETLRLWDTTTRAALQLEVPLDSIKSVAFSADSKLIMTTSRDSKTQLWDSATGAGIQMRKGLCMWVPVKAVSLDSNSKHALSVAYSWLLQKDEKVLWLPHNYRPTCTAVWGMVVALGHTSGRVSILHFRQGPKCDDSLM